jgi:hypothetical protein
VSTADDPSDSPAPAPTALLEQVKRRLAERGVRPAQDERRLFRVVEVSRDARGRLSTQGQVWHTDLDHVRRFGHAVGSNTSAQRVQITDNRGEVVEQIPVCADPAQAAGWAGWRERPLPPLPARPSPKKPAPLPRRPPPMPFPLDEVVAATPGVTPAVTPATAAPETGSAAKAAPAAAPRDLPVVEQLEFDPEATATLAPPPPR